MNKVKANNPISTKVALMPKSNNTMDIHEKTYNTLRMYESGLLELVQELEQAKVSKKNIDKVNLIVTKLQSAKAQFDDK